MDIFSWFKERSETKRSKKFNEDGLKWDELTQEEKQEFQSISEVTKECRLKAIFFKNDFGDQYWMIPLEVNGEDYEAEDVKKLSWKDWLEMFFS